MEIRVRKTRAQIHIVFLVILLLVATVIIVLYWVPEIWRQEEPFPENQEGETEQPVEPQLTRTFDPSEAPSYITPNDPTIQQTLNNIVKNRLIPDWIEIRDCIANKIEYVSDDITHGVPEYWQLPTETLSLSTGDCEDFSILLCSLYRAIGWDEDEVCVVLGEKDGNYHAWVKLDVDTIGWQNIEPQVGGLNTLIGDFLSLSGYTAKYNFNDVYLNTV